MVVRTTSFFCSGQQFSLKPYDLFGELNASLEPSFIGFMHLKLANVSDQRRVVKRLYMNYVRLSSYDPKDESQRREKMTAA